MSLTSYRAAPPRVTNRRAEASDAFRISKAARFRAAHTAPIAQKIRVGTPCDGFSAGDRSAQWKRRPPFRDDSTAHACSRRRRRLQRARTEFSGRLSRTSTSYDRSARRRFDKACFDKACRLPHAYWHEENRKLSEIRLISALNSFTPDPGSLAGATEFKIARRLQMTKRLRIKRNNSRRYHVRRQRARITAASKSRRSARH